MLKVNQLRLGFSVSGRVLNAVDGISFNIEAGETFALLGESGCGKSATAQGILRLLPAAGRVLGGSVELQGQELLTLPEAEMRRVRGGRIAMIFQEPATSLNPVLSVGQQMGEVLALHAGMSGRQSRERMLDLLSLVGIADGERRLREYPFQLSGGMKQRVMIAMALAGEPELLIADEPTTALDVTVQAQILDLLMRLQADRGMGILLITHDLGVVARTAHRVGVMYAGELVEVANRQDFFTAPAHPYTRALFAALPDVSRRTVDLVTIPGQVPALGAMPSGCRFAGRCCHVMPVCREQSPGWRDVGDGHAVRCHWEAAGVETTKVSVPMANCEAEAAAPGLLAVRNLQVHFPIRRGLLQRTVGYIKAVDGLSLELAKGRTLALVGESGCGKTTTGKAILQLLPHTRGSVQLNGAELIGLSAHRLRPYRRQAQMIFQDPFASLNPRLRVGEIIAEGIRALGGHETESASGERIRDLLRQVGMDASAAERYPHEFSGGQRQRIAIARALAVRPELIVCDEPTSALDVSVQAQILNLLKSLQDEFGVAYLFITHNFAVVEYVAHEVAVMYLGRIVERGAVEEVLRSPQHPYTQVLLSAVPLPRLDAQGTAIRLSGDIPSPANPPQGCHFHPRCPKAMEVCRGEYPAASAVSATHVVACHLYR
ncbi:MAG: dipeptide ABC transporter ATP-binding protein [Betaproteobacteria bacterium]